MRALTCGRRATKTEKRRKKERTIVQSTWTRFQKDILQCVNVCGHDTNYTMEQSSTKTQSPKFKSLLKWMKFQKILLKEEKYLYIIQIAIIKESSNNYHFFR